MYPKMDSKDKLDILKDILFADEHEFDQRISDRIETVEKILNERKNLSEKVDPIIAHHLDEFKNNIPETLGPVITETLKKEIKINRDAVVDALYPILGKMVKKYVAQEMKLLSEKIDNQLSFLKWFKRKFRSFTSGENEESLMLDDLAATKIEQVLLIEKDSGILKASYAKSKAMDEEMVSGMLTAIKAFVEDAFNQRNQSLEHIEYELHHIHLQSFATHYIAVVISGNYTTSSKDALQDIIFEFYNSYMAMNLDLVFETKNSTTSIEPVSKSRLEKQLKKYFGNAEI